MLISSVIGFCLTLFGPGGGGGGGGGRFDSQQIKTVVT